MTKDNSFIFKILVWEMFLEMPCKGWWINNENNLNASESIFCLLSHLQTNVGSYCMIQLKLIYLHAPTQLHMPNNWRFWAQNYSLWESTFYFTVWNKWLRSLSPTKMLDKVSSSSLSSLKKVFKVEQTFSWISR